MTSYRKLKLVQSRQASRLVTGDSTISCLSWDPLSHGSCSHRETEYTWSLALVVRDKQLRQAWARGTTDESQMTDGLSEFVDSQKFTQEPRYENWGDQQDMTCVLCHVSYCTEL